MMRLLKISHAHAFIFTISDHFNAFGTCTAASRGLVAINAKYKTKLKMTSDAQFVMILSSKRS